MDSSKIKAIIIAIIAALVSLYLGITAATAQLETVLWTVGGLTFVTCILLGRRIWLLIPFLGGVSLSIRIPSQPDTLLVAQALVIAFSLLLFAVRKLPFRLIFSEIEVWMILILLCVVQAYMRNPTGLLIFGSNTVGGKFYFTFGITWLSSFLLCGLIVPPKELWIALKLSIAGSLINLFTNLLSMVSPAVGFWTGISYASDTNVVQEADTGVATRISGLSTFATNLATWISAFRSPLHAAFHPIWLFLIVVTGAAAMFSGFRTSVISVGIIYLIGIYYRGKGIQVTVALVSAALAVVMLALVNSIAPLPANVQRTLTFLPGTWEQRYKDDAEGSTEWRTEMWKAVLFTDRWISNKAFGDGLGFTARELEYQMALTNSSASRIGISGFDEAREGVIASGNYHSTFVSSVRTVGYVGATIYILALLRFFIHTHRLILLSKNTTDFPLLLFFGLPILLGTFTFAFSAITYLQSVSFILLQVSILRMIENNLDLNVKPSSRIIPQRLPGLNARQGS